MTESGALIDSLPTYYRLAFAYAPNECRAPMLGLLALDARLAAVFRSAREPMLAQIRLAWWREMLERPVDEWAEGEPLLHVLREWPGDRAVLAGLVGGWEAMIGEPSVGAAALDSLVEARADAFAALAAAVGTRADGAAARCVARNWAGADLASRLGPGVERSALSALMADRQSDCPALPGAMRPLAVLDRLASAAVQRGGNPNRPGLRDFLGAVRTGLLGR